VPVNLDLQAESGTRCPLLRGVGSPLYNEGTMRIGVLLAGCGLYDGSDIPDTVFLLMALEARREKPVLLAPDRPLVRVVDHGTTATVEGASRGMLAESARLSRLPVRPLAAAEADRIEALFIPGGYGPAINFTSGFALPGQTRRLLPEVAEFLALLIEARKPIGVIGLGEIPVRMASGGEIHPPAPAAPSHLVWHPERPIVQVAGSAGSARLEDVRVGVEALVSAVLSRLDEAGAEGEPRR
jgi:enhancing lycopene biosynthesis protein 2